MVGVVAALYKSSPPAELQQTSRGEAAAQVAKTMRLVCPKYWCAKAAQEKSTSNLEVKVLTNWVV